MIYTIAAAALALATSQLPMNKEFDNWKRTHNKAYSNVEEEISALKAFEANAEIISIHNAKNLSYTLGHNEFSDLTWEQFKTMHMSELFLNRVPKNARRVHLTQPGYKLADAKDWVADGAVTDVKNQQRCGSCWAFSTTGSVEGAFQIASGKLLSLSEQQLVSCDKVDQGCNGGLMDNAFEYIEKNGITTEDTYPYTSGGGVSGTCDSSKLKPAVTVTGFTDVTPNDEGALKAAVKLQPVSIAVEADKQVFQFYKRGVLKANAGCGTKLDHGVLAVGYGEEDGTKYWKVKNSWGPTWGDAGYLHIERTDGPGKGTCGIAMDPSYPILS